MPIADWNGQLRPNEIFGMCYNMVIGQYVFADNIKSTNSDLVELFKREGTMYGDTKTFTSTDALKTTKFGYGKQTSTNIGEQAQADNLLVLARPKEPKTQAIIIDTFRQIKVTVDNYFTKRAWLGEGVFSQFNSVILGWIADTKRVYDATLINAFIGNNETNIGYQKLTWNLPNGATAEETNRLEAQTIATNLANLIDEMSDPNREYNDYEFLRSLNPEEIIVVWNANYSNKITKLDEPSLFHETGLTSKFKYRLLPKYFGKPFPGTTITLDQLKSKKLHFTEETDDMKLEASGQTLTIKHAFPGEKLKFEQSGGASSITFTIPEGLFYEEDDSIICKILTAESIQFMSGFESETTFFNPSSLTDTHWLTFGFSHLEHLHEKPFITINGNRAQAQAKAKA